MGFLINTDGKKTKVLPESGGKFTLDELQFHVGGLIERVPQREFPSLDFLVHEEELLKSEYEINWPVSFLLKRPQEPLAGPVLVLAIDEWD